MKKSKVFALASVTLLSALALAACSGDSNKTAAKYYSYVYTGDPDTLDYIRSGRQSTHEITTNAVDGLLENDKYGNLVPALAEDWTVSPDGKTYTYKIRKGVKWVDSNEEEYGEVTAHDFVTGLKHAADKKSDALYLVKDSIAGLADYLKPDGSKDFSTVGVKAIDDYTLQYTLNQPESFWNSKLTMGIMMPVYEKFLTSKGDDFGKTMDPSSILYNGPFILKNMTSKSSIEFSKNENYWDKDKVKIDGVKLAYYDGSDVDSLGRGFTDGTYSQARLFPSSSNYAAVEKDHKDEIIYTDAAADTAYYFFNVNRKAYGHTSKASDSERQNTQKAILNKDFRQAIAFGLNRIALNAQFNGEQGAPIVTRTSFVPSGFVQSDGKDFGQLTAAKLESMGDQWKGINLEDGQDGLYNKEKAKAAFERAKAALQAEGVTFPVHLDMPVIGNSEQNVQQVSSIKQSVEEAVGKENIVFDIQKVSEDEYSNGNYLAESPEQRDYDFTSLAWSPDFQDPSTYLNIWSPVAESEIEKFGLTANDTSVIEKVGLNEYKKLIDEASASATDLNDRYQKYAAAQAWLTDSALILPTNAQRGGAPALSRLVPYSKSFAEVGSKGSVYYKYVELLDKPVTKKEYDKAREDWHKEKAKSNEEYQKELAKHVK